MVFFAILCALLLEQARPLARRNALQAVVRGWARWTSRKLDAGRAHHGGITWAISVGVPCAAVLGVHWAAGALVGWPVAMLWDIAVLYGTLGFRQFSRHFTGIRDALTSGDEPRARRLLADWLQVDARDVPRTELVRHVIESSLLSAHRRVFGVLGWYSVLAAFGLGPVGAVLYRSSEFVARYWRHRGSVLGNLPASQALQRVAQTCWHVVDWAPARLTVLSFAVVGHFEAAIDGWRNHARQHPADNDGVILAAGAGALDVRLGGAALKAAFDASASQALEPQTPAASLRTTPGREPTVARLPAVAGLIWRALVMWLVLLALLTLARLLG